MTVVSKVSESIIVPYKFLGMKGDIFSMPEQDLEIPMFNGSKAECGVTIEDLLRAIKGYLNFKRVSNRHDREIINYHITKIIEKLPS